MKYLSAKELGISVNARAALMKTCVYLENGKIKYKTKFKWERADNDHSRGSGMFFNMDIWSDTPDCGTVGCIGGWMEHFGWRMYGESSERDNNVLAALFYHYPINRDGDEAHITGKQAARVARHFLKTGKIDWDKRRP